MNKQQIIEQAERIIRQEAYQGRVQEELKNLGFDAHMIEDVDTVLIEDTLAKLIHEFFKWEGFYELYTNYLIDSIKIGDDSIILKVKYEEDLL